MRVIVTLAKPAPAGFAFPPQRERPSLTGALHD